MPVFFLRFGLTGLLLLALLSVAARALGNAQPPSPFTAGFRDGCEKQAAPCWYGIVPGLTGLQTAIQIFQARAYSVAQRVSPEVGHNDYVVTDRQNPSGCVTILIPLGNSTTSLRLACPGLQLGDVMARFGTPDKVYNGLLYYNVGIVLKMHWLSAYSQIDTAYLLSTSPPVCGPVWNGFASWWRYQQWTAQKATC